MVSCLDVRSKWFARMYRNALTSVNRHSLKLLQSSWKPRADIGDEITQICMWFSRDEEFILNVKGQPLKVVPINLADRCEVETSSANPI